VKGSCSDVTSDSGLKLSINFPFSIVLRYVAVCCSGANALAWAAASLAVGCSGLQWVAVCCNGLQVGRCGAADTSCFDASRSL